MSKPEVKSNSDYMMGGGSSHQLRTPTISSEQGLLNLELTKQRIEDNKNSNENDLKSLMIDYQKTNDKRLVDGYTHIDNRFKNLEHRQNIMNNNEIEDEPINADFFDVEDGAVEEQQPFSHPIKKIKGKRGGVRAGAGRKKKVVQEPMNSSIPTGLNSDNMTPQVTRHGELNTTPMGSSIYKNIDLEYEKLQIAQEQINKLRSNKAYLRGSNPNAKNEL